MKLARLLSLCIRMNVCQLILYIECSLNILHTVLETWFWSRILPDLQPVFPHYLLCRLYQIQAKLGTLHSVYWILERACHVHVYQDLNTDLPLQCCWVCPHWQISNLQCESRHPGLEILKHQKKEAAVDLSPAKLPNFWLRSWTWHKISISQISLLHYWFLSNKVPNDELS